MRSSGVLILFKPVGVTSARWVYRLRPILNERRVGHAGSLDPFADGLLLACVGKATRWVERLMGLPKTYDVTLRLGVTNRTFDTERPLEPVPNARVPSAEDVAAGLVALHGRVRQVPPAFSAVKIGGVSAYALSRRGQVVAAAPREVRIYAAAMKAYEWPAVRFEITCGRGTYIRALARDLGERWGCGAVCTVLRRTRVGPFTLNDAVALERLATPEIHAALIGENELRRRIEAFESAGEVRGD